MEIKRSEIIKKFSWITKKKQQYIISASYDGLICASLLHHHFTSIHTPGDMRIQPLECVLDLTVREYYWMKRLNTVFPYGLNLEYKIEKIDNALWSCDFESKCIYKSFPKIEIKRGAKCSSQQHKSQQPKSEDNSFNAQDLVDYLMELVYSNHNWLNIARHRIMSLNVQNSKSLWVHSIRELNLYKCFGIVDKKKHCLLLIKDLAYHSAYSYKLDKKLQ